MLQAFLLWRQKKQQPAIEVLVISKDFDVSSGCLDHRLYIRSGSGHHDITHCFEASSWAFLAVAILAFCKQWMDATIFGLRASDIQTPYTALVAGVDLSIKPEVAAWFRQHLTFERGQVALLRSKNMSSLPTINYICPDTSVRNNSDAARKCRIFRYGNISENTQTRSEVCEKGQLSIGCLNHTDKRKRHRVETYFYRPQATGS